MKSQIFSYFVNVSFINTVFMGETCGNLTAAKGTLGQQGFNLLLPFELKDQTLLL